MALDAHRLQIEAAGMIEMRVRQNHVLHVGGLVADILYLLVERVGLAPFERQVFGGRPPVAGSIVDDLGIAAGIEQHQPFWMLEQEGGTRQIDQRVIAPVHQQRGRYGQDCARQRP